jgi:hypothetical protein
MANYLIDGPLEFAIEGDRVALKGTSGGEPVTFTLLIPHALISRQRFTEAYDTAMALFHEDNVVNFPLPRSHAADSA